MTANTRPAKLARWHILLLTISGGFLWITGAAWLLLHYFGQIEGPFGPAPNPLLPWFLRGHGLALIPALLGLGGLFVVHFPKGWPHRRQRYVGLALGVLLGLLIVSGYLLYYVGGDAPRRWSSLVHWSLGLATPLVFIWHYLGHTTDPPGRKRRTAANTARG